MSVPDRNGNVHAVPTGEWLRVSSIHPEFFSGPRFESWKDYVLSRDSGYRRICRERGLLGVRVYDDSKTKEGSLTGPLIVEIPFLKAVP